MACAKEKLMAIIGKKEKKMSERLEYIFLKEIILKSIS